MMQKETESPILEKLSTLQTVVHQCEEERNRSQHNLANIAKTHERLQHEQKTSPYYKIKLKGLYDAAIQDANCEVELLRKALGVINSIRALQNEKRLASKNTDRPKETIRRGALMMMLQESGPTLPLWVGRRNETAPPLCGAIPAEPNYVAKVHDMVAALAEDAEGEENWIIAEVINYNHNTNKYEVDDIDEEQKDKHILSRKRIIPLPLMRANPETNPEALFPKDCMVLAVYPQTTCFYAAIVKDPPTKRQENYQILFEDPTYPEGYSPPFSVCQRYVICYKEKTDALEETT